ncbi:MAG: cobalamin biosynthesis protein [Proteobacteria bacterium]|jgi:cobalt-precorrin 5A hydrolase|nr:cobalamin biosynthesis protein [Pseudomonadota bacterium]
MRLALGIGCDRGTPAETLARAVDEALRRIGADDTAVAVAASITLKSDEPGLLALAAARGWPLRFHAVAELAAVDVPNPSETVRRFIGTPSVSEAAALLAAGAAHDPARLLVEKHRVRGADGRNATVSIARILHD